MRLCPQLRKGYGDAGAGGVFQTDGSRKAQP